MSHRNGYPILRKWEKLFPKTRVCGDRAENWLSAAILALMTTSLDWSGRRVKVRSTRHPYCIFFPSVQRSTNLELFPPPKDHNGINPSYQNRNIKSNHIARSCSLLAVVYWQFYAMPWHYMLVRTLEWVWTVRTVSYTLWLKNTEKMEGWWDQGPGKEWEPHNRLREGLCSFSFLWEPGKTLVGMLFFLFWGCMCETQSDWSFKRILLALLAGEKTSGEKVEAARAVRGIWY